MDAPDLMPDFAKKIMIANAPFERDAKSRKRMHYEEFYFTKTVSFLEKTEKKCAKKTILSEKKI